MENDSTTGWTNLGNGDGGMVRSPISFRIWLLWTDRSEQAGLTLTAFDADEALTLASNMGTFMGLGRRPTYQGAFAQAVR